MRMAATGLEFKNVVFNAARDGKLRRLKVANSDGFVDKKNYEMFIPLVEKKLWYIIVW